MFFNIHIPGIMLLIVFSLSSSNAVCNGTVTFVKVPAGTFSMGDLQGDGQKDERPVRELTLDAFEMSAYEITNTQYVRYLSEALLSGDIAVTDNGIIGAGELFNDRILLRTGNAKCDIEYKNGSFRVKYGHKNHPVIEVTWYGAKAFALFYGYDLPTEAEWEYACRAGTTTYFYSGNHIDNGNESSTDLGKAGWYYGNANDWTHPVGKKLPNQWGIYDMHGNVWEWCHDYYDEIFYSNAEAHPAGPRSGTRRVIRGGAWSFYPEYCRSAYRFLYIPEKSSFSIGFRVVRRPDGVIY